MHRSAPSSVFLDDSGPRPLPSYLRLPPPPPPEEKVLTCVPDVSLILTPYFDKTNATVATGRSSPVINQMQPLPLRTPTPTPTPPQKGASNLQLRSREYESDGLLLELINLVKHQSVKIERIENQLQILVKSQPAKVHSEIGVQTDEILITQQQDEKKSSLKGLTTSHEIPKRHGMEKDISPNQTEDLSKILKELQLPISTEQSIYSVHNSSPHVDLPEFTEYNNGNYDNGEVENSPGIGPSVSEYGSSDEEAEIQPTVTYYRNVLGNVNRLLENQTPPRVPKPRTGNTTHGASQDAINRPNNNLMIQQNVYNSIFIPNPNGNCHGGNGNQNATELPQRSYLPPDDKRPQSQWNSSSGSNPTDTTIYGMSTANLSFATRDYLERHGLVHGERSHQLQQPTTNGRPSNRVLDSVLQNQPKFL